MGLNALVPAWGPVGQALAAGVFTWGLTAVGAALVFCTSGLNRRLLDFMLGFAAGVMIAASFFSLLAPALELAERMGMSPWVQAAGGFLAGGVFIRLIDALLPHLHLFMRRDQAEGLKTNWRRSTLLVMAVTLHNVPEGLAVGVAFGAAAAGLPAADLAAAAALALGIGIQNLPEGAAVSVPLRRDGLGKGRAFWYGQLSGVVEPAAAVFGAVLVHHSQPILPFALSFAAGAMIFVVVEEMVPESQAGGHTDLATMGAMLGFSVMMVLDVAFG